MGSSHPAWSDLGSGGDRAVERSRPAMRVAPTLLARRDPPGPELRLASVNQVPAGPPPSPSVVLGEEDEGCVAGSNTPTLRGCAGLGGPSLPVQLSVTRDSAPLLHSLAPGSGGAPEMDHLVDAKATASKHHSVRRGGRED